MSGIAESAKDVTSPQQGRTASRATQQTENVPRTPQQKPQERQQQSAPRSIPEPENASESHLGESESGDNEGEMVPAAGRINENGEVIDDDGNPIGKVTDGEASKFAGYVVTQEGDILDEDGGVVGRAEPLDDDDDVNEDNYTTQGADDNNNDNEEQPQEGSGGLGGALGGVTKAAGSAVGGVGDAAKGVTGAVGDTAKGVTDKAGEATGTQGVTDAVGDTTKGVTDTAGDATKGATGAVDDTVSGAGDTAGDAVDGATGAAGDAAKGVTGQSDAGDAAGDAAGDVKDTAEGVAGGAKDTAEGATGDVKDTAEDTTVDVKDAAGDAAGDVKDTAESATGKAEDATGDVKDTAESATGKAEEATGDVKDATEGATDKTDAGDAVDDIAGSTKDAAEGATSKAGDAVDDVAGEAEDAADGVTSKAGDAVEGKTDAGDAAEGVAGDAKGAAGDVTSKAGEAVEGAPDKTDAGDAVEGVAGEADAAAGDATSKAGEAVEGATGETDAKDAVEGATGEAGEAVEGAADEAGEAAEGAAEQAEDAAEGAAEQAPKIPSLSPSVVNKIAGLFDGPFMIADGGKVTDQSGKVLGKLAEGSDFQDLIGKKVKGIDESGNLLGENDTVIGKVDIAPEGSMVERVKEEVPEAADRLNALEEAQKEAPIQIPSFAPSVAGKVIAMFESPFNIDEEGQVTDKNGKILGKLAEGQDFKSLVGKDIKGIDEHGNLLGDNNTELGKVDLVPEGTIVERIKDEVPEAAERLDAIDAAKQQAEEAAGPDLSRLEGLLINKAGNVVDEKGNPVGRVVSGDPKKLAGKVPDKHGKVWDNRGNVIGEVELLDEVVQNESAPFEDFPDATVDKFGKVIFDGRQVGVVVGDEWQKLIGKKVDADGDILDKNGNVIGHAERQEEEEPAEPEEEKIDYSILKDKKVNKLGNVVDDRGNVWGHVVQGIVKHLAGKRVGDEGLIYNDAGKVVGKAEPVPDSEREEAKEPSPFEDFPNAIVGDNGDVMFEGQKIGVLVEGDAKKLKGKMVDPDGDILDRAGNTLGRAERWEPEPEPEEPEIDMSALAGKRINKAGNAVDSHGEIYGRVIEGNLARLVGKMCDKNGFIRNEGGDVIGKCELIPEAEREGMKEGPFTELTGCTVTKEGKVVTAGGDVVGRLTSGDPKTLAGRPVDDDGDICDKNGNVLGHAERWEEPEVEKDVSPMSGRKVNREGNVVDENGDVIGKLTSGDLATCAGKKIDDDADVHDQKGNKIGHCSLLEEIPQPTDVSVMSGRKVNREGNVVDENGDVIGKLTAGDIGQCAGKKIDDDGDVVDAKGNKLGHCSLLDEIAAPKDVSPMSGRRVNREGNVVNENGDLIGKLTSGQVSECSGKLIDDDGDVVDQKGNRLGHCSLLEEIPEPEPEPVEEGETEEEREVRLKREQDVKIAGQISYCIQQSLDKIKPICRMIVDRINQEEAKSEEDRDEEELVKQVRPLIEEGGKILTEANGVIRGLDPDGRISAQSKHHSASGEASPEEYHLAELLKELTGTVTETIEAAKRKLENLPKAKKGINPLWGLLSEPLFQIIAAVGLLLSGVLGLVGKLLNGLGLGGLVNNLLGGLGLTKVLDGLGLGSVLAPITGSKKK